MGDTPATQSTLCPLPAAERGETERARAPAPQTAEGADQADTHPDIFAASDGRGSNRPALEVTKFSFIADHLASFKAYNVSPAPTTRYCLPSRVQVDTLYALK